MADADEWLDQVGAALGVPAQEVLPKAVQTALLDVSGDVAHGVVRLAVPLTSYLMGVAVGRGATPEEALRIVSGLLPPPAG